MLKNFCIFHVVTRMPSACQPIYLEEPPGVPPGSSDFLEAPIGHLTVRYSMFFFWNAPIAQVLVGSDLHHRLQYSTRNEEQCLTRAKEKKSQHKTMDY